jgi:hypothetical protein
MLFSFYYCSRRKERNPSITWPCFAEPRRAVIPLNTGYIENTREQDINNPDLPTAAGKEDIRANYSCQPAVTNLPDCHSLEGIKLDTLQRIAMMAVRI